MTYESHYFTGVIPNQGRNLFSFNEILKYLLADVQHDEGESTYQLITYQLITY